MIEKTADLAMEVNRVLREYLDIQDKIFRFSFKKALGLVRPDPMAAFREAEPLMTRLESVRLGIKGINPSDDSDEGHFLMALRAYVRAMSEAIESFRDLCLKLEEHKNDRSYRKKGYLEDIKKFQELEANYLEIGIKLNKLKEPLVKIFKVDGLTK